jgi:hypothetical protein
VSGGDSSNGEPTPRALRVYEELGLVSFGELKEFAEVEDARAELRREWGEGVDDLARRREILEQSQQHMSRQLKLVRRRRDEVARLEVELMTKRKRVRAMLRELGVE